MITIKALARGMVYGAIAPLAALSLRLRPFLHRTGMLAWARRKLRGPRTRWRQLAADIIDPRGAPGIEKVRLHGREVHVPIGEVIGRDLVYGFGFETFERDTWAMLLRPDDVVLDVGANIGVYAIDAAALLGPSGRLIAFEPNPDAYEVLRRNLAGVDVRCHLELERRAIGAQPGLATFHCARDSAFSGLVDTRRERTTRTIDVQVTTLDAIVAEHNLPRVDLIKIDVEGLEPDVLAGAQRLLARADAPIVLIEIAPQNLAVRGLQQIDVVRTLERAGYEVRAPMNGAAPCDDFIAFKPARRERIAPLLTS